MVPVRSSTLGCPQSLLGGGEHRTGFVDGDHASNRRSKRLADVSRTASEIADDPVLVEEIEQREQIGARSDHVGAHLVPDIRGIQKKDLSFVAPFGEHALSATRILRCPHRAGDLGAYKRPKVLRRRVELAGDHPIEAAGRFTTRMSHPSSASSLRCRLTVDWGSCRALHNSPTVSSWRSRRRRMRLLVGSARTLSRSRTVFFAGAAIYPYIRIKGRFTRAHCQGKRISGLSC